MPIECKNDITFKDQEQFHAIDKVIMKLVFEIHNELGRFCDEKIYKKTLKDNAATYGFNALTEMQINVSHKEFEKFYYLDLLIGDGVIYELKTVEALNHIHEQQLINYLLMLGLQHGKLVNFRPSSVETRFCSNKFSHDLRKKIHLNDDHWDKSIGNSILCKKILKELLNDWGSCLDFNLYKEALIHFLGGYENIVKKIDIIYNNSVIDQQKVIMLNNDTALHLSGISKSFKHYGQHMFRFLNHTDLKAIQWINFNKTDIKLITLEK